MAVTCSGACQAVFSARLARITFIRPTSQGEEAWHGPWQWQRSGTCPGSCRWSSKWPGSRPRALHTASAGQAQHGSCKQGGVHPCTRPCTTCRGACWQRLEQALGRHAEGEGGTGAGPAGGTQGTAGGEAAAGGAGTQGSSEGRCRRGSSAQSPGHTAGVGQPCPLQEAAAAAAEAVGQEGQEGRTPFHGGDAGRQEAVGAQRSRQGQGCEGGG